MPDRPNRLCICGHRELEHSAGSRVRSPIIDPMTQCEVRSPAADGSMRCCRCFRFRPAIGEPNLEDLTT